MLAYIYARQLLSVRGDFVMVEIETGATGGQTVGRVLIMKLIDSSRILSYGSISALVCRCTGTGRDSVDNDGQNAR